MTEIGVDMVRADSLMCCNNPSLLLPLQMQYTAPAIIFSVPSKPAVPAPVMEYISPSLAVSYARVVYTVPAPAVVYINPAPAASYASPAFTVHAAPAHVVVDISLRLLA